MTTEMRTSASASIVAVPVETTKQVISTAKPAKQAVPKPFKSVPMKMDWFQKDTQSSNGIYPDDVELAYLYGPSKQWPRTIEEAARRWKGPYTAENAATILAHEPIELHNGWFVWQIHKMTGRVDSGMNGSVHHRLWPRNLLEAYDRPRGPYNIDNIDIILSEESRELFHGWLVWKHMTHGIERGIVGNITNTVSPFAIHIGFGTVYPDQTECVMSNGDVLIPDACLISWQRRDEILQPHGPNDRPLFKGGPELVIEARSPSNTRKEDREKRAKYFANGTQVVWDVDEETQRIWVYRANAPSRPTEYRMGDEITCEFLPGWRRNLTDLFSEQISIEAVAGEIMEESREEGKEEGIAIGEERGIAIGKEEGIAIGKEEGIAIGEERGIEQGARTMLLDMLPTFAQLRFGEALPIHVLQRLQLLDLTTLQT
ncbi:MAG: Uma2 family endonuclease, partial [Chloroflexota bacterium]